MPGLTSLEKDVLLFECYDMPIAIEASERDIEKANKALINKGYLRAQVIPTEKGFAQARKIEDRQNAIKSL